MEYQHTKTKDRNTKEKDQRSHRAPRNRIEYKMAIGNLHTSVITLKRNGLNSLVKRNRVVDRVKNNKNYKLPIGDSAKLQRQRQMQSEKVNNGSLGK